MTTTPTRITAIALAAILATAACSSAPEETPEPVVTPTVEATTPATEATPGAEAADDPEPEPQVIEAAAGDVVTVDEADLLPEGQTAYELESGDLIVVDANQPLPEPVREHAEETFKAHVSSGVISSMPYDDFERDTGKKLVVVAYIPDATGANKWAMSGVGPPKATKAEAIATAEAHIAAQDNPDNWTLVVVD